MSINCGIVEVTTSHHSGVTESCYTPTEKPLKVIQHLEIDSGRPGFPGPPSFNQYKMTADRESHSGANLTYENIVGTQPSLEGPYAPTSYHNMYSGSTQQYRLLPGQYPVRSADKLIHGSPNFVPVTPPPSGSLRPIVGPSITPSVGKAYTDLDGNVRFLVSREVDCATDKLEAVTEKPQFIKVASPKLPNPLSPLTTSTANNNNNNNNNTNQNIYHGNQIVYPPIEIVDDGIKEPVRRAPRRIPHEIINIETADSQDYKLAEYNSSLLYLNYRLKGTAMYRNLPFLQSDRGVIVFLPKGAPLPNVHKRTSLDASSYEEERTSDNFNGGSRVIANVGMCALSDSKTMARCRNGFFSCCSQPKVEDYPATTSERSCESLD